MAQLLVYFNFALFLAALIFALTRNSNFNILLVGLTYLTPLIPLGLSPDNVSRFLIVSFSNTIFGMIELVVFVRTVKPSDTSFDKEHLQQLFGHALPICAALIGMSFVSRATTLPVHPAELAAILVLFITGSVMRVVAIYQLGAQGFKFDIAFRENQNLKTDQLYGWIRHPSYTAMMLVVLAYALTTHSWVAGGLGTLTAWFGFQYRIHHEEKALKEQFGKEYENYRSRTGMWLPRA